MADVDLNEYLKQNDAAPAVDLHSYLEQNDALTPEQMMKKKTSEMSNRDDATSANFLDTLLMNHLPHVKAKLGQLFSGEGINNDDDYVKRRDEEIAKMKKMGEDYPYETLKGKAGGFLAPLIMSGGAAAPAAAAEAVPFTARLAEAAAGGIKAGGAYGALQNPGDVEGQVDPLQARERIDNAIRGAKWGIGLGVAVPTAAEMIVQSKAPAQWMAKKVASVIGSIPEETTGRYLENPAAINSAPDRAHLANEILTMKDTADAQAVSAHNAVLESRQKLMEAKLEVQSAHADSKFEASERLRDAQKAHDENVTKLKDSLKNADMNHMSAEVVTAVDELKDKVIEGSRQGFEILGNSKAKASVDPIISTLRKERAGLQINGVFKSPEAEQAAAEIQKEEQRLFDMTKNTDGKLTMTQAKEMLQAWDKRTTKSYEQGAGAFNETEAAALKQARGKLDEIVKTKVPEYRDHMATEVQPHAQLLGEVRKAFGKPEKAVSSLNSLASNKGKTITMPMLQKLDKATGRNISKSAAEFINNSQILDNKGEFEKIVDNLPSAKSVQSAQEELQRLRRPETARENLASALKGPQAERELAQRELERAQQEKKLFSGITPNTITGQTKQLGGANQFAAEKRFGPIDKKYGTNFIEQMRNRNDLDQFHKVDQAGSRKTALGGITGWVIGTAMGHPLAGTEIGAAAGHAMDKFSGAAVKGGLDVGMAAAKGAQKLSEGLAKSERGIPAVAGAAARLSVTPEQEKKGPTAWANAGFDKLNKHASGEDLSFLSSNKEQIMKDPQAKEMLMQASDLKPGSKAMEDVLRRIKARISKGGK